MTTLIKKYADQIGMAASGLCLVHCLLMPFIMAFWLQTEPCASGGCAEEGGFNYDYLFILFSAAAVWMASGHCHKAWLKMMMWSCFGLLSVSLFAEPYVAETHWVTHTAAIGLATAHFLNWRYCRQCNPAQNEQCITNPGQQI